MGGDYGKVGQALALGAACASRVIGEVLHRRLADHFRLHCLPQRAVDFPVPAPAAGPERLLHSSLSAGGPAGRRAGARTAYETGFHSAKPGSNLARLWARRFRFLPALAVEFGRCISPYRKGPEPRLGS